jgi:hypothetical protein
MNPIIRVMETPELWHRIQTYALHLEVNQRNDRITVLRLKREYRHDYQCYFKPNYQSIHWGRWYLRSIRPSFKTFYEIDRDVENHPNIYGLRVIPLDTMGEDGRSGYLFQAYIRREGFGYFYPKKRDFLRIVKENKLYDKPINHLTKRALKTIIMDSGD